MRTRDILWVGHEQARAHSAPQAMCDRLQAAAEFATQNNDAMPPWLDFQPAPKPATLSVLKEEETP